MSMAALILFVLWMLNLSFSLQHCQCTYQRFDARPAQSLFTFVGPSRADAPEIYVYLCERGTCYERVVCAVLARGEVGNLKSTHFALEVVDSDVEKC